MDSIFAPKEGMSYCVIGFDGYSIIDSASVGAAHARGDTIVVPVQFHVLGVAHSEDRDQVGPKNWRFTRKQSVELDSLVSDPGFKDPLRFSCWLQVVPNHMAADRFASLVAPYLDSTSLSEWHAAFRQRPN